MVVESIKHFGKVLTCPTLKKVERTYRIMARDQAEAIEIAQKRWAGCTISIREMK